MSRRILGYITYKGAGAAQAYFTYSCRGFSPHVAAVLLGYIRGALPRPISPRLFTSCGYRTALRRDTCDCADCSVDGRREHPTQPIIISGLSQQCNSITQIHARNVNGIRQICLTARKLKACSGQKSRHLCHRERSVPGCITDAITPISTSCVSQ
jgi:hypothetical protein